MAKLRQTLAAIAATLLLTLAFAGSVLAHGPQPLPGAACNQGTTTAHGSLGPSAMGHDHIPHSHDPM